MQVERQLTSQHKDALDKFLKDPRGLTVKQPYASAILDAKCGKTCENRSWQVKLPKNGSGKWFALHAAGKPVSKSDATLQRLTKTCPSLETLRTNGPRSAIVGLVHVAAVTCPSKMDAKDMDTTPWHTGPYSWEMDVIAKLPKPIPANGKLSFWKLSESQTKDLTTQVTAMQT